MTQDEPPDELTRMRVVEAWLDNETTTVLELAVELIGGQGGMPALEAAVTAVSDYATEAGAQLGGVKPHAELTPGQVARVRAAWVRDRSE